LRYWHKREAFSACAFGRSDAAKPSPPRTTRPAPHSKGDDMPDHDQFPLLVLRFTVQWGGCSIGFSEISGLTAASATELDADLPVPEGPAGLRRFSKLTLRHGVVKPDDEFFPWLATLRLHAVEPRDLRVVLHYANQEAVMAWTIHKAFPIRVTAPQTRGTEVLIAAIELAHEGLELQHN
jgi:phage tail-like protein